MKNSFVFLVFIPLFWVSLLPLPAFVGIIQSSDALESQELECGECTMQQSRARVRIRQKRPQLFFSLAKTTQPRLNRAIVLAFAGPLATDSSPHGLGFFLQT